eukprot:7646926-Alexandrium_andersonii.AAC.1
MGTSPLMTSQEQLRPSGDHTYWPHSMGASMPGAQAAGGGPVPHAPQLAKESGAATGGGAWPDPAEDGATAPKK